MKLPPFWAKDPLSWFTLVESTFNRHNVVNSRLRFDLVLPALPEEVIEQIRGVLRAVDYMDHPYVDLKARLSGFSLPSRQTHASSSSMTGKLVTGGLLSS